LHNATDPSCDLLFGLFALQVGMIEQGQLVAAFQAWTRDKSRPMAAYLLSHGYLESDQVAALEGLVSLHVKKHEGDPERSLAAVPTGRSTRERLNALGDAELTASLAWTGSGSRSTEPSPDDAEDLDRTPTYSVGAVSSLGQRFRVLRPHARGGLGAVFVALDTELPREVALKQILDRHADDPSSRQRFLLEAEITGGLEHPGIVPVYGLGTYSNGRPFYAMRFIRGDSLKDAIETFHGDEHLKRDAGARSLAVRKLLLRFLDVCNAIEYAHGRGVLHRDIKPGNVIVGKHGETLVVDWGLAKAKGKRAGTDPADERPLLPSSASGSADTLPGSALGTPAYMSPEQAGGNLDQLGPRSDVYSLGATLYCLLTGSPPLEGEVADVLRAAQQGKFPPPRQRDPKVDRSLETICLRAMARKPEDRYSSARALAEDGERWIADEPVSARREPISARLARWSRRHRTGVAALGLSLATAVVLLAISTVLVSRAQRDTARALARVTEEQGRTASALARADANFRRARQAVDDSFTTISEELLLDEPGMQPLRTKLLQSALRYHEVFLKERAGDPSVETELAESHRRLALISLVTGRGDDPLSHLHVARERFTSLAQRYPDHPEYRRQLANTLSHIGEALMDSKPERDHAIQAARDAIAIIEPLVVETPNDARVLEDLATTLVFLGLRRAQQKGGSDEAAGHMRRARGILEHLIAANPDALRSKLKLAELHSMMYNNLVGDRRRQAEALESSQHALRLYSELAARSPNSPRFKFQLGQLHDNRCILYLRSQNLAEAIGEGVRARRLLSEVVRTNPENRRYLGHLGAACSRLGLCLTTAGRNEEALVALRESSDALEEFLMHFPGDTAFQGEYMGTLSALGSALGRQGHFDESAGALRREIALVTKLCERDPNNIFLRGDLMVAKFNLATSLTRSGRHHEEAVALYEQSLAMSKELFGGDAWGHSGSDVASGLLLMAYSLREVGRETDAERAVATARKSLADDPPALSDLAGYEARGAQRLKENGGDSHAVVALEDQAIETLRRAVARGFTDRPSVQRFGATFQFADRAEFKLILLDVTLPADPFAPKENGAASPGIKEH
jgi:serine/threonine-protein kinase